MHSCKRGNISRGGHNLTPGSAQQAGLGTAKVSAAQSAAAASACTNFEIKMRVTLTRLSRLIGNGGEANAAATGAGARRWASQQHSAAATKERAQRLLADKPHKV